MPERWFRNADARYPFLREDAAQAPARWHGDGEGPVQYLADTPDGAWAEFLRHEAITDPADLQGIERNLWAIEVELDTETIHRSSMAADSQRGDLTPYPRCQADARSHRADGATALRASSAALDETAAGGQCSEGGALVDAPDRAGQTLAIFGARDGLAGWLCCDRGRPGPRLVHRVRQL